MMVRQWRARAAESNPHGYPAYFRSSVLPTLRRTAGFIGAQLSVRQLGNELEFQVQTRWQSMEAIRGFAGSDADRAVVEPPALAELLSFDPRVEHYQLIVDAGA